MPRFRAYRENLLTAPDEPAVDRILREATASVPPEELAALPEAGRAAILDRRADVHSIAVVLLHLDLSAPTLEPAIAELLRQFATLYATASVRLSQISARAAGPAP